MVYDDVINGGEVEVKSALLADFEEQEKLKKWGYELSGPRSVEEKYSVDIYNRMQPELVFYVKKLP